MAKRSISNASAEGRVPPPSKARFIKGKSGNPRGRPKGAISTARLTRKIALRKQAVVMDGKPQKRSRLEIAVLKTQALAASGKPAAARLLSLLRVLVVPREQDGSALLLVPEELTTEEFIQQAEARNATLVEPGTAVNIEAEEFLKAVRGEPTAYGEALLAFHRKYRGLG